MELLNPANLNYWQQILKNKDDIAMLKETSTHFTYAVGLKLSLRDMPFDVNNVTINKSDFHGYIINRVYQDGVSYQMQVKYNNKTYTTDMFVFFGTTNGLYVMCFPKSLENGESILYLGKWNETSQSYEYCNQITTDLADAIQELTESLSNYQTKLTFDETPTLGSNNPVTSDGIKQAINEVNNNIGDLPSLETTAKDNLVNAINELKNSSGSGDGADLLWSGGLDLSRSGSTLNLNKPITDYKNIIITVGAYASTDEFSFIYNIDLNGGDFLSCSSPYYLYDNAEYGYIYLSFTRKNNDLKYNNKSTKAYNLDDSSIKVPSSINRLYRIYGIK